MRKAFLILILFSCICSAQSYSGGGGTNSFYQIPFSPREISLGGSNIAISEGVFSSYWNPAGIVRNLDSNSVVLGINSRFDTEKSALSLNSESDTYALGFVVNKYKAFDWLPTFAFNMFINSTENLIETKIIADEIILGEAFSAYESLFMLTIAYENFLHSTADIGLNLKMTYTKYFDSALINFAGLDFGVNVEMWDTVAFLQNIESGTVLIVNTDRYFTVYSDRTISYELRYGISGEAFEDWFRWNIALIAGNFTPFTFAFGAEFIPMDGIYLRGGFGFLRSRILKENIVNFRYSLGLGFSFLSVKMDISYILIRESNDYYKFIDTPLKLGLQIFF